VNSFSSMEYAPSYETFTLDRLKAGVTTRVGAAVAESMRLESWQDQVYGDLMYGLTAHVLAETLPPVEVTQTEVFTLETPVNWFEHLKLTCYRWRQHRKGRLSDPFCQVLAWLERRWPARLEATSRKCALTVNLERYRTYPKANIVLPPDKWGMPVRVAVVNRSWLHDAL
jgi:hypothetical protein